MKWDAKSYVLFKHFASLIKGQQMKHNVELSFNDILKEDTHNTVQYSYSLFLKYVHIKVAYFNHLENTVHTVFTHPTDKN